MRLIDADALLEQAQQEGVYDYVSAKEIAEAPTFSLWEVVYNELTQMPMLTGSYDAKNGNKSFMYGISTVMECVACFADKEEEFEKLFCDNMIESERKAQE